MSFVARSRFPSGPGEFTLHIEAEYRYAVQTYLILSELPCKQGRVHIDRHNTEMKDAFYTFLSLGYSGLFEKPDELRRQFLQNFRVILGDTKQRLGSPPG